MLKSPYYIRAYVRHVEPFLAKCWYANPKSSPVSVFCSIYETFLLDPPPLVAFSLTPPCSHSLHHSVLWLQIYSDSSPQIQCTVSALTVATGVCLHVWVWWSGCVTPFTEEKQTKRERERDYEKMWYKKRTPYLTSGYLIWSTYYCFLLQPSNSPVSCKLTQLKASSALFCSQTVNM